MLTTSRDAVLQSGKTPRLPIKTSLKLHLRHNLLLVWPKDDFGEPVIEIPGTTIYSGQIASRIIALRG
jgi:hypothetical protein